MYLTSGHLPYYAESMFPPMELAEDAAEGGQAQVKERYYLKAMNCPHHHKIFSATPRSYRELPLRLPNTAPVIATSNLESSWG